MSVDLSPGLLFAGNNNQFHMNQPGFVGHVGLGFKDWVALYGQMEVVRLDAVGTDVGWYGGVKLGSRPGCVAALAALVLYSVALTTIDTGFH
jgi:hypothetical protein